jgi:hypothetical protein
VKQVLLATAQLAVVTPLFTTVPNRLAVLPLLAIVALGALGTGVAMLVQYGLVAEVGPTTAQMSRTSSRSSPPQQASRSSASR